MEIKEFISKVLSFGEGWVVEEIQTNEISKEIDIYISYTKKSFTIVGTSQELQQELPIYDFSKGRRIRHLDLFQYKTFINARLPRFKNKDSDIRTVPLSWAGERVSYSYLFESKVIKCLSMSKNQTKTADFFDTTFDIVHSIMERAVERGLQRRRLVDIEAISLDEKSYKSGHNYITVLSDPISKRVLDIIDGRKTEDVQELITFTLSPSQCDNVKIVTMDMWDAFMKAATITMPQADIVHDKFHVAKYLNKAVDDVRKKEVKAHQDLKHTKYLWLKNAENWIESQRYKFEQINEINLLTAQAWHLKENFKGIYELGNRSWCLTYFEDWYKDVVSKNIPQMIRVADTLLNHLKGIVNAAIHAVTNSMAENLNAQIQIVKSVARGFANVNSYRNAILFFQGKLCMNPC